MTKKTTKKSGSQNQKKTMVQTPEVYVGFNFLAAPSPINDQYYVDLILDTRVKEVNDFVTHLHQIHTANVMHERAERGNDKLKAKDINLVSIEAGVPDSVKDVLELTSLEGHPEILKLRAKSDFQPKIYSASLEPVTLKKNLPSGAKIKAQITLASYFNGMNSEIGTTFYLQGIQLSPMPERSSTPSAASTPFTTWSE